jgi:hypothetical protein
MGGFETYLIQKGFDPEAPRSSIGQNVNIIHVSMLYWPEERINLEVLAQNGGGIVSVQKTPPPVRVGERPHGEHHLMNPGMRVTGV